ncbi:MAG: hypothetical protein ISR62_00565 [Desulfobacteraceae bacterium]|nr:hypothetical protein [Desulfobacterales bacterium]MBL6966902.1 hypothetical protein [Desulfobacteraceae bacterium]MBL7101225.1 hypothetical protein [Desulfobacteraceae bacterium]MBL7172055.1 hypothetical protein [Desulfobacteraceae bacterium]
MLPLNIEELLSIYKERLRKVNPGTRHPIWKWVLDTGYWILDTGCWMLGAGCWILDAGDR